MGLGGLTLPPRTAIRLAATPYRWPAVRETHALEQLRLTPSKFWALVHRLIDRPDVVAEMPMECARLRRLRDARAGVRRRTTSGTHG